ncbi:MAG: hypothetical protein EAZ57_07040, partial [Cytophagales bacterium]
VVCSFGVVSKKEAFRTKSALLSELNIQYNEQVFSQTVLKFNAAGFFVLVFLKKLPFPHKFLSWKSPFWVFFNSKLAKN